ncbi:MAG: hypothetical protein HWN79_14700 [Candidatus Lokiarchaeota archaeon]|nr:hypothetical protein [Candidatus Lokiarchaeota archaeon]
MSYSVESEKLQKFVVVIKYLQFVFLAILLYGTAMLSYDIVQIIPDIQISAWSIGCTVFGGEGAIVSYFIIRSTEKKIAKIIKEGKK